MKSIGLWVLATCLVSACSIRTERTEVAPPPPPPPVVYAPQPEPARVVSVPPDTVGPSRDEYGFRYDAKGNRIDARGNIISPQSTTP
jgi:hypothetical protein